MAYDNDNHYSDSDNRYGRTNSEGGRNNDSIYSKRVKAGKRRTYFFDVRATRGNDYFITITESKKRFEDGGYDRHKMFLYKEDFHKFVNALQETVNYVKTDLMPDFDFDAFNHENDEEYYHNASATGSYESHTAEVLPEASLVAEPAVETADVAYATETSYSTEPAYSTEASYSTSDADVDSWKA